jgi:16S rRNA (cytosine967-C5)-methyltransferase
VVLAVEAEGAYANLVLPRRLRERRISGVDAAFATELTYGTLRWQGVLDEVITAGAKRAADSLDPEVRAVLRLGSYQLLHMRVPPHAAVSTSVDLVRETVGERPAGFVNAVLRRVSERDWSGWTDHLAADRDPIGRLAFANGYPEWVATALLSALDGDLDELAAALAADRPATHLLARPGRITRDDLLAMAGEGAIAGSLSPYAVQLDGGDPSGFPAVRDGRARVQDEGSQLVALALAALPVEGAERWWLDLCAGPGGKSSLLSGLLPSDVGLLSVDRQPHRAALVRRGVDGSRGGVAVADGTQPAWPAGAFARVLADVPCTGLGALRRRPEVRWRREPADVDRLGPLQRALLDQAIDATQIGGMVVYSTCSPHPAETTEVVRAVIDRRADAELVDVRAALPMLTGTGPGPFAQLWPHRHGTDAMFIAAITRKNGP